MPPIRPNFQNEGFTMPNLMTIKDGWSLENDAKVYLLFSVLYSMYLYFFFNPLGPEFEAAVVG